MADWFKFYCDGLDEPRFRYALRTLSEVCPVWLLILSECCRSKSDTIEWTGDEVDLIGWGEKAAVSPAMVNEAVKLLDKIRYIELSKTHLRVRKWNELQSDYCRQFTRKKKGQLRETPRNFEKLRLEERRGEEIRGEERWAPGPGARFPEVEVPSWKEFWSHCQLIGMDAEWYARNKFNAAEQNNWQKQANWRAYAVSVKTWWENDGRPMAPTSRKGNGIFPETRMKSLELTISRHPANPDSTSYNPKHSKEEKEHLKGLRAKLEGIQTEIANTP